MKQYFTMILRAGPVCFTEAYTNKDLGVVKNGQHTELKKFWIGNIENYWDQVVEIRLRADEMPQVFIETDESRKFIRNDN